tara:strand:- start:26 stop:289 length:264 start_codon:yes stop_codon:yes gene_type:complete
MGRIWKFSIAAIKHACRGMPTCTQEQINERLKICKSCPHFTGNGCAKCGCNCGGKPKFLNKLAWADQECPIGKWERLDKPQDEQEPE